MIIGVCVCTYDMTYNFITDGVLLLYYDDIEVSRVVFTHAPSKVCILQMICTK